MFSKKKKSTDDYRREKFGAVGYQDRCILYPLDEDGQWRLSIDEIAVVGEFNCDNGLTIPNYSYVFVTWEPCWWYELPYDAIGRDRVLDSLSLEFGFEVKNDLMFSTELESKIVWPLQMFGEPLFQFVENTPWWRKYWLPRVQVLLTPAVLEYVQRGR